MKLVAIADDLTGANDTALQFAKHQLKASVLLNLATKAPPAPDCEVLVVDSDSRDYEAKTAYQKVYHLAKELKKYGAECVYKKMDSTLRGNWGAEIRAMDDVFAPELVIIAPAYPETQRITVGGYHLLHGQLVELTEIGHAPKTPVHESYIPELVKEQVKDCTCAVLDFSTIKQGTRVIRQALEGFLQAGKRWVVCDIADDSHFASLLAALKGRKNILWAGSAGLAEHLVDFYGWQGSYVPQKISSKGNILICAGSVSKVTQNQIAVVKEHENLSAVKLDIAALLVHQETAVQYAEKVNQELEAGNHVILLSAENDEDVQRAVEAGSVYGFRSIEVSEKIACIMAEIVSHVERDDLAGMVLTGGDTAVHICRALGISGVEVRQEITAGVPLGVAKMTKDKSLYIVTKAGAFGTADTFSRAIEAIQTEECEE